VNRQQQLSTPSVLSIVKQTARALQYLHATGHVHQDVKPGNILMTTAGRAILADFGVGHTLMSAEFAVGSAGYQAPEALDDSYAEECHISQIPQKEDVWGLGVTLYQLLFMRLPFVGTNLYEIVRVIRDRPLAIPDGTDQGIAALLRGMLAVDQCERFGIDDVLAHPLIQNAPDRAPELPPIPPLDLRTGEIRSIEALVCTESMPLSSLIIPAPRRMSLRANLGRVFPHDESDVCADGVSMEIAPMPLSVGLTRWRMAF
jgi:serine/threonine protein kinase